jgi:hypothetical protein
MKIEVTEDLETREKQILITMSDEYLMNACEPYDTPEFCALITPSQGMGIIEDAVLMAMHLKRRRA